MRIVGGANKGAALVAPKGDTTRPTSDRLRETIFNILSHRFAEVLEGGRVLDLFAGSGALGLEALSRGASFALFVDNGVAARGALRTNIAAMQRTGMSRVWRRNATKLGPCPVPAFALVFCDPPYGRGLGEAALVDAAEGGWVQEGAIAVLEERRGAMPAEIASWRKIEVREVGDSAIGLWEHLAANGDRAKD